MAPKSSAEAVPKKRPGPVPSEPAAKAQKHSQCPLPTLPSEDDTLVGAFDIMRQIIPWVTCLVHSLYFLRVGVGEFSYCRPWQVNHALPGKLGISGELRDESPLEIANAPGQKGTFGCIEF